MEYRKLREIVIGECEKLSESAAYSGAWNDGGSDVLRNRLNSFHRGLVVKYDLRPSEVDELDTKEVGEPKEFESVINSYKMELAKHIKL